MLADPPARDQSHRARILTPLTRGDYLVFVVLLVLPIVLYASPVLVGHLFVPGDDLNQNLPLRILSGSYVAAGHIPAWNPLIWSGTPLLAGWNAGALFPGTVLFAFLPIALAWTINVVATPLICSVGIYLLLRRFAVSELGALFGALIFTYTGFMSGQMVHLGLVQGTAFMPWIILGLDVFLRGDSAIAQPQTGRLRGYISILSSTRTQLWILVIALSLACTVLAGDPRAITSTALVAIVYIIVLVVRDYRPLRNAWLPLGVGLALGFLLSGVQSVPGLAFLNASQRGTATLSFFGTGSLPPREIFINSLLPFNLGTSGALGLPAYSGNFNLPEVTIGAGLIVLVAICSYLPELFASLVTTLKHRHRITADPRRQLGVWLALFILGAILTLGTDTPLGRALHHIPLYGTERLQNRNAVILDFALAVFGAFFFDDVVAQARERRGTSEDSTFSVHGLNAPLARVLGLVPVVATLVLVCVELITPLTIQRWLAVPFSSSTLATRLLGYLIVTAVLTLAIGGFWLLRDRLSPRAVRATLTVLLVCDIGMYVANTSYATASTSNFTGTTTLSAQIKHDLGGQGRFAIFDPLYYLTYTQPLLLEELGFPDINAVQDNPSVQGYGSIVNGVYQRVTGTHLIDTFNASIIPGETVNTLDLRLLLVPSGYLDQLITATAPVPVPTGQALTSNGSKTAVSGPWTIQPGASQQWQLPAPTSLGRTTFLLKSAPIGNQPTLGVTLFNRRKTVLSETVTARGTHQIISFAGSPTATTMALTNPTATPITVNAVTVVTNNPRQRYVLNGLLQGELNNSHWVYDGVIGSLTVYRNIRIHGFAWLQSPTSHTPNTALSIPGSVQVDRGAVTDPTVMTVRSKHVALLVRSEAYASGWSATVTPLGGGPSVSEKVRRFGLIQQITVPAGRSLVTWHYEPSSITTGLILTFAGLLITLCLVLGLIVRRYRAKKISPPRQMA